MTDDFNDYRQYHPMTLMITLMITDDFNDYRLYHHKMRPGTHIHLHRWNFSNKVNNENLNSIEFNSKTSKIVNNKKAVNSQKCIEELKNIQEFKSNEEINCEMMFLQKAAIYTADLMHDNTR